MPLSRRVLTCLILGLWVHVPYLFTECVIKSCDPLDWLILTCYQSASACVTETTFLTQKCFSVENLIIVSLNTVIPIIKGKTVFKIFIWGGISSDIRSEI